MILDDAELNADRQRVIRIIARRVIGLLLLASSAPILAGIFDSPVDRAIATVRSEALDQHMPTDFLGVPWLTPTSELLRIRLKVVAQGDGSYMEPTSYVGRNANISYYANTGNVLMYVVIFTDGTNDGRFVNANKELDKSFGPMPEPKDEVDEYGKKRCSHREAPRFAIDHCVRVHGQVPVESIVFSRRKSS